jgi:glucan phosphoethanolaminetransferase (alkaline phosphatase superfamily)
MRNEISNKNETTTSHKGHMWMMAVCCGLPIIGFLAIAALGVSLPSLETALLLICPIGMIGMMFMMNKNSSTKSKTKAYRKLNKDITNLES